MNLRIKLASKELKPTQGRQGDAGYDLKSTQDIWIPPGEHVVVPTGVSFQIPYGYYGFLTHRSSLAFKSGCIVSTGIIDSSFTGEVKALVMNLGNKEVYLKEGERFCQIIFHRYYEDNFEIMEELEDGKEGFGSSNTA